METWTTVKTFPDYSVSTNGKIKSNKTGKVLKTFINTRGYEQITLYKEKKKYGPIVHRLVLESFVGEIDKQMVPNHIDGDKLNNNLSNLEIVTISQNNKHAFRIGLKKPTKCFGTSNGMYRHGRRSKYRAIRE